MGAELKSVKDTDWVSKPFGTPDANVTTCEAVCNGIKDCAVVNWHKDDYHCHTLVGTVAHKDFAAALTAEAASTACILVEA